jgi:hypothetical protein
MTNSQRNLRVRVLESCGAEPALIDELLAYGEQSCRRPADAPPPAFPLPDDPQVETWLQYEREARGAGAIEALRRHLVQLRFPVRAGISEDDAYRQATRRGVFEASDGFEPPAFRAPDRVQLTIVPTMSGRLPIIVAGDRRDFETLVQALTARNEPEAVPASMGACLVKGLNNWSRIAEYRRRWESDHPDEDWSEEFKRLIPRKELYQDRFIILSTGAYSAMPAAAAGLDDAAWLDRSLVIRREHELTHYFVYRVFGVMRSHAFDEIVADFIGLSRAFGEYRDDLALRFLGLESFPAYRAGGRLENYRSDPPLSDDALAVVRALAHRSVRGLRTLSASWPRERWDDLAGVAGLTFAISQLTLEELASPELPALVEARRP